MVEIIGVRFKSGGKQYYFDPKGTAVEAGQGVIIETSRGIEYGECVQANTMVEDDSVVQPLRPLIRIATQQDLDTVSRNHEKESKAFTICQQKILDHGLDMKLVDVEYNFEGNKILFFFTSEGRVDFRALVKDLASVFHSRIELRQIGVRDEAKMLGGLGVCGRPFCCASFMEDFQPVSIKMAKTQNLSLNPTKISGTCGRLMCCLKYEQEAYEDAVKRMPKNESFVETPDGVGNVCQVNLLREQVKVRLEDQNDAPHCYHNCEICVVRNGKGKRPEGYVAPPPEELAKLRKVTPPPEDPSKTVASNLNHALSNMGMTGPHTTAETRTAADGKTDPAGRLSRRNRGRRGGKPSEGQPVQTEASKQQRAVRESRPQPPKPQKQPKPIRKEQTPVPQQSTAPVSGDTPVQTDGGEKKPKRRRRYRPRPKSENGKQPPKAD